MIRRFPRAVLLALGCGLFLGGCGLSEIARKEDISAAKTDISEEILQIRNENRALSDRLDTTTQRVDDLMAQIDDTKKESADSAKFIQEKLGQLNTSIGEAKKDQEKISSDFSQKIQVVLDEVSKETAKINQKVDKLGEAKKGSRTKRTVSNPSPETADQNTYTVVAGDTLAKIAKRTGVPLQTLLELNQLENANDLRVGQRLILRK